MQNHLSKLISCALLAATLACGGGNQALISQTEIDSARASGRLPSLYDKATALVAENRGSSKKEAIALQSKIAKLLIDDKNAQVDTLLTNHEQDPSSVTRATLLDLKSSLASMQSWSATEYARVLPKVEKALTKVNGLIASAVTESGEEGKDPVASVLALKRAAALAGEGQPELAQYQKAHEDTLSQLIYQGNDGLNRRLYNTAINAAKAGLTLDPGNIQFESMLSQGQAGLFEKDFRFALENGKPESAYQSVMTVADNPIFLQLKKSMHKSILLLANYFAGAAQKSYQSGDLLTAYNNFIKARTIQQKLGVAQLGFIQEKRFLDLLMAKTDQADLGEGQKQAYMRIINELDASYPGLSSKLLKNADTVKKRAMTKLSIAEFKEVPSQNSVIASVGRRIGSKLEKILFDRLGNEVLIVTDSQNANGENFAGLALQIDGEVLQAAIENSSNQGRRTQQVQTGMNRVETEEYASWKKRKRGEAPKQYHETPILESVELIVEHIRKQAIAEVAFRIIEPANGAILLTDNVVKASEFSGESINEFQKGDFHQPYVRADLPSDIKIMDDLSSELATQLGEKLSAYLQSPEQVFYQKAQEAKAQANPVSAIELLANAIAIGEGKGKDVSAWLEDFKSLALAQK